MFLSIIIYFTIDITARTEHPIIIRFDVGAWNKGDEWLGSGGLKGSVEQ